LIPANKPDQEMPIYRFVLKAHIRRFLPAQEGTTAIEYAVIAAGIAGVLVAVITTLGGKMVVMWGTIAAIFG
jgi:pilus assembly protein Flp/PilA